MEVNRMGLFNNKGIWGAKKTTPKEKNSFKAEEPVKVEKGKNIKGKQQPKAAETKATKKVVTEPAESYSSVDPDLQFQVMYGLVNQDGTLPGTKPKENSGVPATTEVQPTTGTTSVTNTTTVKGIVSGPAPTPVGVTGKVAGTFFPKTVYKRLVNKKLTIILLENTATVAKQKDKVLQIVENFVRSDFICIINYGSEVNVSEIIDLNNKIKDLKIMHDESAAEESCLYDALVELEKVVSSKYLITEETAHERICTDSIDIIGIGTCRDNCSKVSKDEAIDKFYLMSLKSRVVTKYYCLTDEFFIGAAEIGFHSIGAISKAYQ